MTLSGQLNGFCLLNGMRELWIEAWKDFYELLLDFSLKINSYHTRQPHIRPFELAEVDLRMKKLPELFHFHRPPQHEFLYEHTNIHYIFIFHKKTLIFFPTGTCCSYSACNALSVL